MASGLPVVAPRSGFVAELVSHGRTGYLTGPDPVEIASRLAQLAGSPAARSGMARLSLETARARFDPALAAARTLDLYEHLAGPGATRAAFETTRSRGVRWRIAPDFNDGRPLDMQRTPPAADLIQSRKGRTCFRVSRAGGLTAVVKRHRPRAFVERLKYAVVPSRARAEWRNSSALAASGVSTPRALAWAESRRFGLWAGSELVMEGVFPGTPLPEFLERPEPGVGIAGAAQDLAVQIARVHSAGFHHRDLHGGNILVGAGHRPGGITFHLIDLHEARRTAHCAGMEATVDDLGRLNSSVRLPARLRLLFLRRYIACRGWPPGDLKPLARAIDARTRAIWARHLRKHGTHIETYGA
jgi:tRNA A-37 threonylcarbamoyl transferase component Bud32